MNTNNSSNIDIQTLIDNLNNDSKAVALRTTANHMLIKSIGAARQMIRERERTERDAELIGADVDQRNQLDEDLRSPYEFREAIVGTSHELTPLEKLDVYASARDWATLEWKTVSNGNSFYGPMTAKAMLDFMTKAAEPLSPSLAETLATHLKCDVAHIHKLHDLQALRDRERMTADRPEIEATLQSMTGYAHEDSLNTLNPIDKHQLAVKIIEKIKAASDQVLMNILKTKRLGDLAKTKMYEDGINAVRDWIYGFEMNHMDELAEAAESGRLRSVEDVI